jgi:predicted permease
MRFASLFDKRRKDQELQDEMESHIQMHTEDNLQLGMTPEEARRQAMIKFGGMESTKEAFRDQRGLPLLETLWQDLRYGARMLRKNPGFTTVAVLTLALGIGVNTSMFSALQTMLARPLPYPDAGNLVQVFQTSPHSRREPHHSVANFLDYRALNPDFEFVAAMDAKPFNLSEPGQPPERVQGLQVSADFFPLLGIHPALGRVFTAEEDRPGRNNVVILDYGFWLRRFVGDTNIIGRVIRLDGESVTVVGVMPSRFHDVQLMGPAYLWCPIAFTDAQRNDRGNHFLKCIARLKPGLSLKHAQSATDMLAVRLSHDHVEYSVSGMSLVPLAESSLPPNARRIVWSIMALAGFVLLIACANLANLQFARTAMRGRELAVRGALGAPRGRVLRQLLVESLLLAFIGGLLGVVMAFWSNELLSSQFIVDGQTVLSLHLNLGVLGFALSASTISGLAFGLMPAWLASRCDVNEVLKQGSRGATGDRSQHRMQHSLVVVEMALALVLLTGAGLAVSGLRSFAQMDPGWRVDGITVGYLTLPESKYGNGNLLRNFADRLEEKLAAFPGVERVGLGWTLPVRHFNGTSGFTIDGRPKSQEGSAPERFINGVTPGYFRALGMKLVAGRDFTAADTTNRPAVVMINETMARTFWPTNSAIGELIDGQEIVGVVNNVKFPANPEESTTPYQTYCPFAQSPRGSLAVAVRGIVTAEMLRRAVAEVDPDQPVGDPGTARADIRKTMDNWAVGGRILSSFGLLGLSLAGLGIYGVISGFVARRTGEIGVRMALGAQLRDVLWLVLGKGLRLALIGTAIGLVGAFGVTRLLASVLPQLPASNLLVTLFMAALLTAIAVVACWVPARRAARVDPMVTLRNE